MTDFGAALAALKGGARVARRGWNGKGMFLFLSRGKFFGPDLGFAPGLQPSPDHPSTIDGVRLGLFVAKDPWGSTELPCIAMATATKSVLNGWLASQTDMLAEDWIILED